MDRIKDELYDIDELLLQAYVDRDTHTKDALIIAAGKKVIEVLEIIENEIE